MRIAFYAPLKPPDHLVASGDRTVARALLEALTRAGHEVQIASRFRSYDQGDGDRQDRLRRIGERLAARLLRRVGDAAWRPELWFTYHLYHKAPDWLGPAVAAGLDIPYVIAEASYAPKQADGAWRVGHRAVEAALRQAGLVVQLNPADAECVRPLLASPGILLTLPPFLDTKLFRAGTREASRLALAARFGLDPGQPWLLTAAMMRADQKLDSYRVLADALGRLADLPWRLLVAGSGPAEAAVHAAFRVLGDRIVWAGTLDPGTLRQAYRAADLYVWPAIKEAWGMALVEAQAAGLPVVAGRSGGVASVVEEGVTGLLTPEGDVAAFAGAIRELVVQPSATSMLLPSPLAGEGREGGIPQARDSRPNVRQASARTSVSPTRRLWSSPLPGPPPQGERESRAIVPRLQAMGRAAELRAMREHDTGTAANKLDWLLRALVKTGAR